MSTNTHAPVRITLLDLVYGAVLGYGFDRFDTAVAPADYVRWSFGFLVLAVDWIYVHKKYMEWDYKHNSVFVLDMIILFLMSRLFSPSHYFWFWVGGIFVCYAFWDVVSKWFGVLGTKEFVYSIAADLLVATILVVGYVATETMSGLAAQLRDVVLMTVYFAAVLIWLPVSPRRTAQNPAGGSQSDRAPAGAA